MEITVWYGSVEPSPNICTEALIPREMAPTAHSYLASIIEMPPGAGLDVIDRSFHVSLELCNAVAVLLKKLSYSVGFRSFCISLRRYLLRMLLLLHCIVVWHFQKRCSTLKEALCLHSSYFSLSTVAIYNTCRSSTLICSSCLSSCMITPNP